jgi:hypothetical protein
MKRQNLAAVSVGWTVLAAEGALSATISSQLHVAHKLQGHSEFLYFSNQAS